ncbi:unnamed protein product [Symbiodinium sp. KB8]|nr:unnamed protein product [Symbiodinium sp. KB8]|mmetsp:Transcript_79966/g.191993  ORF Transcript_79966/g.191993 Transcript_79966/m.191993 type:complete len:343 (-) Transcript_79966:28-1056(-)
MAYNSMPYSTGGEAPGVVYHQGGAQSLPTRPLGGYGTIPGIGYPQESGRPPSTDKSLFRRGVEDPAPEEVSNQVNMLELVFLPWFLLVLVLSCYLIAGANGQHGVLWLMPLVLIALSAAYIRYNYRQGNTDEVVLGSLSLTGVIIAAVVGLFCNINMLQELHRVNQGASYFNVLASESATSKLDATSLVFTNTTRLSTAEYFGFTDASTPAATIYCVAPVKTADSDFKRIQFWAAGLNCCGGQEPFKCGDAQNPQAHGGLLLPERDQGGSNRKFFEKAIQGAVDKYGLEAGNNYLLLNWMQDPIQYRDNLWKSSWKLFAVFGGVYLIISIMVGFVILPILRG